jgi:hypothetical protein
VFAKKSVTTQQNSISEGAHWFRIKIPNDVPNFQLTHFVIVAQVTPETRESAKHNIVLLCTFHDFPPSSGKSLWGLYRNEYGMLFTAFRGDTNFAQGINYACLLSAPRGTTVRITSRADTSAPIPIPFLLAQHRSKRTFFDAMPIGR